MDLFVLLVSVSTFYFAHGKFCPDVTIMADFDPTKISGSWYTIGHTDKDFASSVNCIHDDFQILNETTTRLALNANYVSDGSPIDLVVILSVTDEPQVYKEFLFDNPLTGEITDYVSPLGSDYETYLIAYNCDEDNKRYNSWIVTTQRQPPESVLQVIMKILSDNGVDFDIYGTVAQTDCTN